LSSEAEASIILHNIIDLPNKTLVAEAPLKDVHPALCGCSFTP
jgi:hypothetical protein